MLAYLFFLVILPYSFIDWPVSAVHFPFMFPSPCFTLIALFMSVGCCDEFFFLYRCFNVFIHFYLALQSTLVAASVFWVHSEDLVSSWASVGLTQCTECAEPACSTWGAGAGSVIPCSPSAPGLMCLVSSWQSSLKWQLMRAATLYLIPVFKLVL